MSSQAEVVAFPRIVHEGSYRLYEKADGTLRVQYLREGSAEEDHFEIPGEMVNIVKQLESGQGKMPNPMDIMRIAMKFMGGM